MRRKARCSRRKDFPPAALVGGMLEIPTLEPGQPVSGELAVRGKRGLSSYANGYVLRLELGNATGALPGKVWMGPDEEAARAVDEGLAVGDVVDVQGRVSEYRGQLELAIEHPPERVDPATVEPASFLPGPEQHLGRLAREVLAIARSIQDGDLRGLVLELWTDEDRQPSLLTAPATKRRHRARLGGLLEHVRAQLDLTEALTRQHPDLDADLLVAGLLLAPVGTLGELAWGAAIEITDEGRLLGPGALAEAYVRRRAPAHGVPAERALRLRHLVRTAHGREERGPQAPRTPEAIALRAVRELDVRTARALGAAQRLAEQGETAGWPDGYRGYLDAQGTDPALA